MFDPVVGDCTRFWYGGCDGNDNRFDSQKECSAKCIKPTGIREYQQYSVPFQFKMN